LRAVCLLIVNENIRRENKKKVAGGTKELDAEINRGNCGSRNYDIRSSPISQVGNESN
jgi:hypothetical protein